MLLSRRVAVTNVVLAVGALLLSGCVSFPLTDKDGTTHYVIIGFGVVSVPEVKGEAAVRVVRVQALGLTVTDQPGLKVGLGLVSSSTVSVPSGAKDVRVEVSQKLGGPLKVSAESAILK